MKSSKQMGQEEEAKSWVRAAAWSFLIFSSLSLQLCRPTKPQRQPHLPYRLRACLPYMVARVRLDPRCRVVSVAVLQVGACLTLGEQLFRALLRVLCSCECIWHMAVHRQAPGCLGQPPCSRRVLLRGLLHLTANP